MKIMRSTLLFALAGLLSVSLHADETPSLLHVSGVAELKVPADQMEVDLSVVSEAADAETALAHNARAVEAVVAALKSLGLRPDEYRSGQFRIQPQWTPPPRNPPPDWRAEIVGFSVSSPLYVVSKKHEVVGPLIGAVVAAGANQIDAVRFSLSEPRRYRKQAIDEATKNALEDAQTLAHAAGVRLVEVRSLTVDDASFVPLQASAEGFIAQRAKLAADSIVPPFNPGDTTVSARVSVTYRIATLK